MNYTIFMAPQKFDGKITLQARANEFKRFAREFENVARLRRSLVVFDQHLATIEEDDNPVITIPLSSNDAREVLRAAGLSA